MQRVGTKKYICYNILFVLFGMKPNALKFTKYDVCAYIVSGLRTK